LLIAKEGVDMSYHNENQASRRNACRPDGMKTLWRKYWGRARQLDAIALALVGFFALVGLSSFVLGIWWRKAIAIGCSIALLWLVYPILFGIIYALKYLRSRRYRLACLWFAHAFASSLLALGYLYLILASKIVTRFWF
jgi:hypothetical protein